jgi:hypothetical protein
MTGNKTSRIHDKTCPTCKKDFKGVHNQVYCSKKCGSYYRGPAYPGLSNNSAGAVSELRVCADLLIKGYEVFRAVSPSSSCDVLALKGGKTSRIEVRTSTVMKNGTIAFSKSSKDAGRSDHYAAVGENKIHYFPPLPEVA